MTLIKSISGIRGTIGGRTGDNLTPFDIVLFTSAYGEWLLESTAESAKVVIGRDARLSGSMVTQIVGGTLLGMGIDVIDLELSTTPTVEMAVVHHQANGGVILTASHNPGEWNALKLLDRSGEFISAEVGSIILQKAEARAMNFAPVDQLGTLSYDHQALNRHILAIESLPGVDKKAIKNAGFKVVVDGVNSSGGIAIPALLKALGVTDIVELYCEPTGIFPHNPEPLPAHLNDLCDRVVNSKADLGIVIDPDVDRLAFVSEDGSLFGEEYTLVAVSDYVLSLENGNTVSNLSSSRALRDITTKHGGEYFASAVGEVNVVEQMKACKAVIGGEGNGGIIVPKLHYGRDALVGVALFLSHLATSGLKPSELRKKYPDYFMAKKKVQLTADINTDQLLEKFKAHYIKAQVSTVDGVKVDFEAHWIHLRKSNTEPIIRVYVEAQSQKLADQYADETIVLINSWT